MIRRHHTTHSPLHTLAKGAATALLAVLLPACDGSADKNTLAEVGSARLTVADVLLTMPLGTTGNDSIAYQERCVDDWVDDQLLYEQGRINLPNMPALEAQVADYRRRLVAQTYEDELMRQRLGDVDDDECFAYYEAHSAELRLTSPLVQGLVLKVLSNTSRLETLRRWLKELSEGNSDNLDVLEEYAMQHAAAYDNFYEQWVELPRLNDLLPTAVGVQSLQRKPYEARDADFVYLYVVRDVRRAGDVQPYEYALPDIRQTLRQQRRAAFHRRLLDDLRDEGMASGFVKINNQTTKQ